MLIDDYYRQLNIYMPRDHGGKGKLSFDCGSPPTLITTPTAVIMT